MSRQDPSRAEDPLLVSARQILKSSNNTFKLQDWRITMATKNAAKTEQAANVKAAAKRVVAKGVTPYKHEPKAADANADDGAKRGVDTPTEAVVNSGFSIFNPSTTKEQIMTEATTQATEGATQAAEAGTDKPLTAAQQAAKAKQDAKQAELQAKMKTKQDKQEAKAKADKAAAEAKAAKDAEKAAKKAENEKLAAERKAAAAEAGRTYTGSMLALSDRVKQGVYVKGSTGQLRSTDNLAIALDAVPPKNVVALGKMLFPTEQSKYDALNIGQQSMNWRNRMRGAIRKGTEVNLTGTSEVITLELIKGLIASNNFAIDVTAIAAQKAAAKAAADKAKADKLAAEDKAKAEKAAAKAAAQKATEIEKATA